MIKIVVVGRGRASFYKQKCVAIFNTVHPLEIRWGGGGGGGSFPPEGMTLKSRI